MSAALYGPQRFKCERNGGWIRSRAMLRRPWKCFRCGKERHIAGHRCKQCHRRICCPCFDHEFNECVTCAKTESKHSAPPPQDPNAKP